MSHWYITRNGIPQRYYQYNKTGEVSKIIRRGRAQKEGAVESITTILSFLGESGGLLHWTARHAIEATIAVLESGIQTGESQEAVIQECKKEWKVRTEAAAEAGTAIHEAIEHTINTGAYPEDRVLRRAAVNAIQWLRDQGIDAGEIMPEHCVLFRGEIHGLKASFGATVDIITPDWIVDWKTVADKGRGFRKPKASESAQVAGCRIAASQMGLCEENARCSNVYIDRETGDITSDVTWTERQLEHGRAMIADAIDAKHRADLIESATNITGRD